MLDFILVVVLFAVALLSVFRIADMNWKIHAWVEIIGYMLVAVAAFWKGLMYWDLATNGVARWDYTHDVALIAFHIGVLSILWNATCGQRRRRRDDTQQLKAQPGLVDAKLRHSQGGTITTRDYFNQKIGNPEANDAMYANAEELLGLVIPLLLRAEQDGAYAWQIDPDTGTCISGSKGGSGDGGFRLSGSTTGSKTSAHKQAKGIDIYDPANTLDNWLTDELLEEFGLYREAPHATPGWCHLQSLRPGSGRRTFNP